MKAPCGCCEGVQVLTPMKRTNRPGLSALSYRVGTHASFLETMKARLSSMTVQATDEDGQPAETLRPLAGLTTREQDDPSIALLDAWATVADVLSFYQERIANEGYLRTAIERRSVLELARLVGYTPRPGVSASVYLAFTLQDGYDVVIPAGARAQSLPGAGELPQSFETSNDLEARAEWNTLTPRMTTPLLIRQSADLKTIDTDTFYVQGTATNLKPNDPLLFVFGDDDGKQLLLHVKTVEPDNVAQKTKITLQEAPTATGSTMGTSNTAASGGNAGQPAGSVFQPTQPKIGISTIDILGNLLPSISAPPSIQPANSQSLLRSVQTSFSLAQDTGPQLIAAFRPDLRQAIYKGLSGATVSPSDQLRIYAFRVMAPLFGNNAPQKQIGITSGVLQTEEWPLADVQASEETTVVNLDNSYDGILPGSWVVVDTSAVTSTTTDDFPAHPPLLFAKAANPKSGISRSAYSLSAKTTRIELASPTDPSTREAWISFQAPPGLVINEHAVAFQQGPDDFQIIRRTMVYAKAEELTVAEKPITDDICQDRIELSALYNGLKSGRWIVVSGERADLPLSTGGVPAAEVIMLSGVEQTFNIRLPGDKTHSTLLLANKPAYCYKRDTIKIYGNVVDATHGETRSEVLGSGDSSKSLQEFALRQSPLTWLPAPTAAGATSTLQVRVNDILWHETDSLDKLGPTDRDYVTQTDDDDKTTVITGNGKQGARPATGAENVKAVYRTGIGQPGNVDANQISLLVTRPLGVKGVTNPVRASGGADRETRDQARKNVPLAVMALDRLVSVQDYQDFARTFAGIGKANATQLSNGTSQIVHLTIAGADDIPIDLNSDLYRNFVLALRNSGDEYQQFVVVPRELMLLVISAKVRILPDYEWESVATNIRSAMLDTLGFERRDLGQSVFLSEVISAIQQVPGVAYVDVDVLDSVSESDASDADRLTNKLKALQSSATKPNSFIFVRGADLQSKAGCSNTTATGNICPAQLAVLSPDVPDTLILTELTA